MAVSVGTAYVSIIPSTKGFAKTLDREARAAGAQGGKAAGEQLGKTLGTSTDTKPLDRKVRKGAKATGAKAGHEGGKAFSSSWDKAAAKLALGGSAVATTLAVKKLVQGSVQAFRDASSESMGMQRVLGGTIEEMSTLRGAAKLSGVSADTMAMGMRTLSRQIFTGSKAFEALGIQTKDARGNFRSTEEILKEVADRFEKMPNGAEKSALSLKLFGRSGTEMLPMLNRGAKGIGELEAKTKKYGLTLTKADQDAVKKFTASQRELSFATEGSKVALGRALFPALTQIQTQLVKIIPPLTQALIPAFKAFGDIAILATGELATNMPAIKTAVADFAKKLTDGAQAIRRNWPQIRETIRTVGDAVKRVGQWTKFLWDQFNALPGPVKEMIALLVIAQKTGVMSFALKGFDLAKNLFAKLTGMTVQAAVVNVNGPAGGAGGAGGAKGAGGKHAAGKAGIAGLSFSTLGLSALAAGFAAAFVFSVQQMVTGEAERKRAEQKANPNTAGGTWGGSTVGFQPEAALPAARKKFMDDVARYNAIIRDGTKSVQERRAALDSLRGVYALNQVQERNAGASVERLTELNQNQRVALMNAASQMGMTDTQAAKYSATLGTVKTLVATKFTANTAQAETAIAQLRTKINEVQGTATSLALSVLHLPVKRAYGGMIPGAGTRDTTPVLATPGEWMLTRQQVQQVGAGALETWRQGGPPPGAAGFSVGQLVINNPKPEPASDSLPRSIRKLQHVGAA